MLLLSACSAVPDGFLLERTSCDPVFESFPLLLEACASSCKACVSWTSIPISPPKRVVAFSSLHAEFPSLGCSGMSKIKDLLHVFLADSGINGSVHSPVTSAGVVFDSFFLTYFLF
ncbi:hypothetical protein A2U01_0041632 [Trifolium medium]|uniref:Uncharacterized protein n=1 Tax=Trifolium medium TaxID=97028 RepID=A0A392Q9S0_9FABA|nr:hypothetical protein [Trifolium medium]